MTMSILRDRGTLTAVVGAAAALAIAIAVYGRGCNSDDDTARAAAHRFLAASAAGDAELMVDLMSKGTRERLRAAAHRATELVGGSRRYTAAQMISVSPRSPDSPAPALTLVEGNPGRVVFEVDDGDRPPQRLVMVDEDGWRVELPTPAAPAAPGSSPPSSAFHAR